MCTNRNSYGLEISLRKEILSKITMERKGERSALVD